MTLLTSMTRDPAGLFAYLHIQLGLKLPTCEHWLLPAMIVDATFVGLSEAVARIGELGVAD